MGGGVVRGSGSAAATSAAALAQSAWSSIGSFVEGQWRVEMMARRALLDATTQAATLSDPLPVFTVAQVRERFFPGRCARWIKDSFKRGEFGPVFFDGGRWFISAEAISGWQRAHQVHTTPQFFQNGHV
jgi:hypothetical protein